MWQEETAGAHSSMVVDIGGGGGFFLAYKDLGRIFAWFFFVFFFIVD